MSKEFKCPECGNTYDTKRGFHIHVGQKHSDKKEEVLEKAEESAEKTEGKTTGTGEGKDVFDFDIISKPVKVGVIVLILVVLGAAIFYGSEVGSIFDFGMGNDPVDRAVDLISASAGTQGAEVTLLDSSDTGSGIYEFDIEISMEGMPSQNFTNYVTEDGEMLFQEGHRIDAGQDATVEQIGEEGAQVLKDTYTESMQEQITRLEQQIAMMEMQNATEEQISQLQDQIDLTKKQMETLVIEFSEDMVTVSGLHHIKLNVSFEADGQQQQQAQEAYATKDGKYLLIGAVNITEQKMMMEEAQSAEEESDTNTTSTEA